MPESFHIARAGQVGAYPESRSLVAAICEAFEAVRDEGVPVTVLCAVGPFQEGARVEWTPLAVISPPAAPEEASP